MFLISRFFFLSELVSVDLQSLTVCLVTLVNFLGVDSSVQPKYWLANQDQGVVQSYQFIGIRENLEPCFSHKLFNRIVSLVFVILPRIVTGC